MLTVHHSNRLERLADDLAESLRACNGGHVLKPRSVIVPHPSMGRWLQLKLAERTGIAANLEFPLPARFIWQLFHDLFPDVPRDSRFDRGILSWRLMALLEAPEFGGDPTHAPLLAYLKGTPEEQSLKRYQLAQQLAALYDRYLTYRRDWIAAWEAGKSVMDGGLAAETEAWQASLWRRLQEDGGADVHWAGLLARLENEPELLEKAAAQLPEPLHVFGLTSLSPAYLDVFRRLAERLEVRLFFLSPSKRWLGARGGQGTQRSTGEEPTNTPSAEHPLLASMGGAGLALLEHLQQGQQPAQRAAFDDPAPEKVTLLQAVQADLLSSNGAATPVANPVDGSIAVHSCHSRMREVQVLHDQLLAILTGEAKVRPRDVVVMAPDIAEYAPYIGVVFNRPHADKRFIPYTISDRAIRQEHPVISAFWDLLNLPISRWTGSEVLDLLRVPAISRRYDLTDSDHERLKQWVEASGIRWGLDAGFRETINAGRFEQNSWRFGLDRLLMGYAVADDGALVDGVLPYPFIEGGGAEAAGKLANFVDRLSVAHREFETARSPRAWRDMLLALINDLFAPPRRRSQDPAVREAARREELALQLLRSTVHELGAHPETAGYSGELPWQVVREHLGEQLQQAGPSQPFLDRGITFCALLPMRSLPFKVVCLLGMNSGDFPRQDRPPAFDLMAARPRPADRSARADDRYLFLESLLAARQHLYLSYIGRDIKNNKEREPAVVISELLELLQTDYGANQNALVTEHRMQPFSRAYFTNDSALFSYAAEWAEQPQDPPPFLNEPLAPPDPDQRQVTLKDLASFFRKPAKHLIERRLQIRLPEVDESLDEEPHKLARLTRYQVCQELVEAALAGERIPDEPTPRLIASGRLPPGLLGEGQYKEEAYSRASTLHAALEEAANLADRHEPIIVDALPFELADGTRLTLSGVLRDVYANGLVHWRPGTLRAEHRLRLWIEHLAVHVATGAGWHSQLFALETNTQADRCAFLPLDVDAARSHLADLMQAYWDGLHGNRATALFFPDPALEYAKALRESEFDDAKAIAAATKKFDGDRYSGRNSPHVAMLIRGIDDPLGEEFQRLARRIMNPLLDAEEA